jgi:hypothetical protein
MAMASDSYIVRINNQQTTLRAPDSGEFPSITAGDLLERVGLHKFSWILFEDAYGQFSAGPAELRERCGERFDRDEQVSLTDCQCFVAFRRRDLPIETIGRNRSGD